MVDKLKRFFRRKLWLWKHRNWENTRQKRKCLENYLKSFDN